jgi:WD40 repeat protein
MPLTGRADATRWTEDAMVEDSRTAVRGLSGKFLALLVVVARLVVAPAAGRLRADDDRAVPLPPRAQVQIGTDELRTRDQIAEIAFSPDGQLIAAAEGAYSSSRVSLFAVRTGRQVGRIAPPDADPAYVVCVAFSPDGKKLAWGEQEGHVALWDLVGARLLHRVRLHDRTVNALAFSPDGRMVASGDDEGAVHVRRVDSLAVIARESGRRDRRSSEGIRDRDLLDRDSRIFGLAFTPDGTRLVGGSTFQTSIVIWRLSDGQLLRRIAGTHAARGRSMGNSPSVVAVTPDGLRVMSSGQRTVPITETKIPYGPADVSISEVRFWDIESGERVLDLYDDEEMGYGMVALSRDGRRIAAADFGVIRILEAATGRSEGKIALPGCSTRRPAFSPDGTLVAVPVNQAIHVFEVQTGRRLLQDESVPAGQMRSAAWSPSGDRIATGHNDGVVRVWDAATGKPIWHKVLSPVLRATVEISEPLSVAFSGDGRRLIAAGHRHDPIANRRGIVTIYDAASGALARAVPGRSVYQAAPTTDGRIIVLNAYEGSSSWHLVGIQPETGRQRWSTPAEGQRADFAPVIGMQLRSNTPFLETATSDGHVVRFNALTGRQLRRFRVDGRPPEERDALPDRPALLRATFSADGRTLASTAREWIYIWDVESGKLRCEIRLSHQDGCFLALAPDGRTLAIATGPYPEDAIRLVDVGTGTERLVLRPGDKGPRLLAFSPDGTRLFTGFDRGSAIVWDVRHGEDGPEKSN